MFNIGGEKLMSLREALEYELNHRVSLKESIPWSEGDYETDFLQPRLFSDGETYYAPMTTKDNPVYMASTPIGDENWKQLPREHVQPQPTLSEQSIAEAIKTLSQASQELQTSVSVNSEGELTIYSNYHEKELTFNLDSLDQSVQYIECVKKLDKFK